MKKQNNLLQGVTIALTFFGTILFTVSCNSGNAQKQQQNVTVSQAKPTPPKIDIHTAVFTGNLEALKQHIAAGYLKRNEKGKFSDSIKKVFSHPFSLLIVVAAFIVETSLMHPMLYELYAMTWHGFFLGLLAFFFGFCFVFSGLPFWNVLKKWRWFFLSLAAALYIYRLLQVQMKVPNIQLAIESNCWIFSVFAFGYKYLNHPGRALRYVSQAAYPVYLIHMIFLYLASLLIFPLDMDVHLKFILVLGCTFAGCFIVYEFVIRRIGFIRVLFGLKSRKQFQGNYSVV